MKSFSQIFRYTISKIRGQIFSGRTCFQRAVAKLMWVEKREMGGGQGVIALGTKFLEVPGNCYM